MAAAVVRSVSNASFRDHSSRDSGSDSDADDASHTLSRISSRQLSSNHDDTGDNEESDVDDDENDDNKFDENDGSTDPLDTDMEERAAMLGEVIREAIVNQRKVCRVPEILPSFLQKKK